MKKKLLIVLLILITLGGCTKRFNVEDENKKTKSYVSNIYYLEIFAPVSLSLKSKTNLNP